MHEYMQEKMKIYFGIELSDTVTDPLAVMIHAVEADVALPTVSISMPFDRLTNRAYSLQYLRIYLFPQHNSFLVFV